MTLSFHSSNYLQIEAILNLYAIMHRLLFEIALGDNDIEFHFQVNKHSMSCVAKLQEHGYKVKCFSENLNIIVVTSEMPF